MLIKGVTSQMADDSRTGGRCYRTCSPAFSQLLVTVMTFHVNLLSFDHPERASYEGRFVSGIIAILAKALINANIKLEFNHDELYWQIESVERLLKTTSPVKTKNRARILKFSPCSICVGACLS